MKLCFFMLILLPSVIFTQTNWEPRIAAPLDNFHAIKFFDVNTGITAGENGVMLKTTNGGMHWQSTKAPTTKKINLFYFLDETNGLACGDSGLILFTTNRGSSWIIRNSGTLKNITSLARLSFTGLIGTCSDGDLIRTSNGGLNWYSTNIAGFNLNSIHIVDAGNWFVCGDSVVMLKTTNSGNTWLRNKIDTSGYNYTMKSVHFTDINTGNVTAFSAMYHTTNSGVNWVRTGNTSRECKALRFVNANTGYVLTYQGPIFRTTNTGSNWNYVGPGNVYYTPWNSFDNIDTNTFFICGNGGQIIKSTNKCTTITNIGGLGASYNNFSFYSIVGGVSTYSNYILTTATGGDRWNIDSRGSNNWFEPTFTTFTKVKFSSITNGAVIVHNSGPFTFSDLIMRSSDGGNSFYGILGGGTYQTAIDIETIGEATYAMGRFNSVNPQFYSATSGGDWSTVYTFNSGLMFVSMSFANANTGIVAGYIGSTSQNFVTRTTNAGLNWSDISLSQTFRVRKANMLNDGNGYILCDSGMILKSTDFGANWLVHVGTNSNYYKTINFLDNYHGYAITASNKLAFSSDGGSIWSLHDVTIPDRNINAVQFVDPLNGFIGGDSVFLKTTNGGLTFITMQQNEIPVSYSLSQNYPNPFNPVTNIKFEIPKSGFVKITIFDLLGREITTLIDQQMQPGSYNIDWDASKYPSGVYFYKLEVRQAGSSTGDYVDSKKMVLVK
ncbi:MAG: T9SS type A sorting domain-containing protein [Ignavibacteria bacterium]|nr:T9SS type A sorting domain-containing protein [Ignavibacteria bacterium]